MGKLKIEVRSIGGIKFCSLKIGEVFEFGGCNWIKISDNTAFNLDNLYTGGILESSVVIPRKATLVIE